ncbi:histone H1A, sperm-like [Sipha flava]|uniref:Histone H1A, sperm-like n=1 Tax=Sipha flava TaxID=143950 RepID=A0A8B8GE28_9HEMI|nr:histone H1A, sperm-like [Sipha flava]
MTDIAVVTSTPAPVVAKTSPKKMVTAKAKPAASSHPNTAIMVIAAVKELKGKKDSSLQGIKKFMAANYKVDSTKLAPFIRKFLKAPVAKGLLVQTNGSGASSHFKMATETIKSVPKKKIVAKKPAAKKAPVAAAKKKVRKKFTFL